MNDLAGKPANQLATGIQKAAEIPRRMADIDASLGLLEHKIEELYNAISPALRESQPCSPTCGAQADLPPGASQIEASLYQFNTRIEVSIDSLNRLTSRIAL